ncbi:MAG: hypothetical protein LBE98_01210 [Puniceicoccales bacterium]|jgi:hypothetical protein|nr:hypothetical protein [Puniceicoccales bacterium]
MSTQVAVNTGGYDITPEKIAEVTNPFLDFDKAIENPGIKFYFLEGQYDQVVLSKIFTILYSLVGDRAEEISTLANAYNTALGAYQNAVSAPKELQDIGAYELESLVQNLDTYTLTGIFPSKDGNSCSTKIDEAYADILSIVCDLYEEAIGGITLTDPTFAGNTDLSTLKTQLDTNATSLITTLGSNLPTNLKSALNNCKSPLEGQIPLNSIKTALEGLVGGVSDETKKNNINAAIAAINTYNTTKNDNNLNAVKTALNAIKDYTEVSANRTSITHAIAIVNAIAAINTYNGTQNDNNLNAVKTALNAIKDYTEISADNRTSITNAIAIASAITAITTYNTTKNDNNLNAVKTALDTIKAYTEISADNRTSITHAIAIVNAIAAITTYNTTQNDANLESVKDTLILIKDYTEISTANRTSISSMISNIGTYLDMKAKIGDARTAINTFTASGGGGKTKANLDILASKLSALNTAIGAIPTSLRTTYDYAELGTSINTATSRTSGIRSRLNGLTTAIDAYKGATSLVATPALFQEIKSALDAFFDNEIQTLFVNSLLPRLSDRTDLCNSKTSDIFSIFEEFYDDLNSLVSTCQSDAVKNLLTNDPNKATYYRIEGGLLTLKEDLTYSQLKNLCDIVNGYLGDMAGAISEAEEGLNKARGDYESALAGYDPTASYNDLLNLCMMASTPKPQADGTYKLVTGIQRSIDANGNYTYALMYNDAETLNKGQFEASFSKGDGYVNYSLPYLALAIMYEKVGIQQMILVEQLKQVEKINEAIRENNTALKVLSFMYEKVYSESTKGGQTPHCVSITNAETASLGMTVGELDSYLESTVRAGNLGRHGNPNCAYYPPNGPFNYWAANYNKDGDVPGSGGSGKSDSASTETQNIDVKEQATLTMLSNKQDSTRIYGDQLSTDSQLMTTKMSQYMQDSNACVSACTQVVKSVGEYYKSIISNIRA